jgi:DNA-binding transcriptional ArsR family regulator
VTDFEKLAQHASDATAMLKLLANENRLMICCSLDGRELSVSQLNEMVPLSQSALSQHLAKLRDAGILSTRREAQTIFYQISDSRAMQIVHTLKTIYCP